MCLPHSGVLSLMDAVADLGLLEGASEVMAHEVRRKIFGGATATSGNPPTP